MLCLVYFSTLVCTLFPVGVVQIFPQVAPTTRQNLCWPHAAAYMQDLWSSTGTRYNGTWYSRDAEERYHGSGSTPITHGFVCACRVVSVTGGTAINVTARVGHNSSSSAGQRLDQIGNNVWYICNLLIFLTGS
jgi:hypothetical protein